MTGTLLENLLAFYEEDPGDPFNIYSLAIEYLKTDPSRSGTLFEKLLAEHPDYLPTYYHAAAFFAEREQIEKAEHIYKKGASLALLQQNNKTHQELIRAYRNFLDELDD